MPVRTLGPRAHMDDAIRHQGSPARRPGVAAWRRLRPVKRAHVHVPIQHPAPIVRTGLKHTHSS